jgi:hypothetical protein
MLTEPLPVPDFETDDFIDPPKGNNIEVLLASIAASLEAIAHPQQSAKALGFCEAPRESLYVFCNRKHGGVWYSLDENSNPTVIEHGALEGYLKDLKFEKVSRKAGRNAEEVSKLHIVIEGDRRYTLECGAQTQFSKGVLSAIATLTPEAISKQTITLVPSPSTDSDDVLFCNVYTGGQRIYAPYDSQTDFRKVAGTALNMVELANPKAKNNDQ